MATWRGGRQGGKRQCPLAKAVFLTFEDECA